METLKSRFAQILILLKQTSHFESTWPILREPTRSGSSFLRFVTNWRMISDRKLGRPSAQIKRQGADSTTIVDAPAVTLAIGCIPVQSILSDSKAVATESCWRLGDAR